MTAIRKVAAETGSSSRGSLFLKLFFKDFRKRQHKFGESLKVIVDWHF